MSKINDLKKLPPDERIRRLKEIAEKDKKEIVEAQKLLKESEKEAEEEAEMLRKVPIPQMKAVDIDSLFSEEEKDAFSTLRYVARKKPGGKKKQEEFAEPTLEEQVAREKPKISEEELRQNREYLHQLGTVDLQHRREDIYQTEAQRGYLDHTQQGELYNIRQEIEERKRDAEEGKYKTDSKEVAEILGINIDRGSRQYRG